MKVNVERLSDNQVKLAISLDATEFQGAIKTAFEKVVKDVKVDGFRQGKVPFSIYIARFGYESLYEEAIYTAVNEYYPKAVFENKVDVVAAPQIDFDYATVKHDGPFTFTATVDVLPKVYLGEYLNTKVKPLSKEVTEADIENEINRTLRGKAENVIKEGAIENGDVAIIDFEGFLGDTPFDGGKAENYPLEVGSQTFIPGFEEQLLGLKSGDEKDIFVTFPENYGQEQLAGKEAKFKIVVHEVKTKVIPELTNELVEELNIENVKTVDEYRQYIQEKLQTEKLNQYEEDFTEQVIRAACANAKIDIPESMIEQEIERRMDEVQEQADYYKIPLELYLRYNGFELDQFKEEVRKACHKYLFEQLVLEEIAKVEKIEVTEEDIKAELAKMNADADSAQAKELIQNPRYLDYLRVQKTIQILKEKAIVE